MVLDHINMISYAYKDILFLLNHKKYFPLSKIFAINHNKFFLLVMKTIYIFTFFILCTANNQFAKRNQQNPQYLSTDMCIIISHWIFPRGHPLRIKHVGIFRVILSYKYLRKNFEQFVVGVFRNYFYLIITNAFCYVRKSIIVT